MKGFALALALKQTKGNSGMSYCSVPLQIWAIYYDFKEHDILLGIRSPLQLAERTGFWTCTGHIYLWRCFYKSEQSTMTLRNMTSSLIYARLSN